MSSERSSPNEAHAPAWASPVAHDRRKPMLAHGPRSLILAIENSNPSSSDDPSRGAGVCIGSRDGGVLAVEWLRDLGRDEDDLIPAIDRAVRGAGVAKTEIGAVAVSVGPGGFTSTRMSTAAGAMIAEGLGVEAVAVPTALSAWANRTSRVEGRVGVFLAGKGDGAWCAVIDRGNVCQHAATGRIVSAEEVAGFGLTMALADRHVPGAIRAVLASAGVPIEPMRFTPEGCLRASLLCPKVEPAMLVPIYPREPEAVTLWRQRHPPPA